MKIRDKIRALIRVLELTQSEVAREIGVSKTTLYRYLSDQTDIGSEHFIKLVEFLSLADFESALAQRLANPNRRHQPISRLSQNQRQMANEMMATFQNLDPMFQRSAWAALDGIARASRLSSSPTTRSTEGRIKRF